MKKKKNDAYFLTNGLVNLITYGKFVIIWLLIGYVFFDLRSFEPSWYYLIGTIMSLIPLKLSFDNYGIRWFSFGDEPWKNFKYYNLEKHNLELFDKNKNRKMRMAFFYQKNLEPVLRKHLRPVK